MIERSKIRKFENYSKGTKIYGLEGPSSAREFEKFENGTT